MPDEPKKPDTPKTPVRKPDAILYPQTYKQGATMVDRLKSVQEKLGPVLGGKVTHNFSVVGRGYMAITGSPEGVSYSSFDWEDQPDGTSYGYRKKDPEST